MLLLTVSRYPLAYTLGLTTSRWDQIVSVTTTRALPVLTEDTQRLRRVGEDAREIDEREGEHNLPRVKLTRRAFSCATYKVSPACAETLWCGELIRVLSQSSDRRC